ncbi:DUF6443 domain-containing protein [Chitinophaga rhizophila]|uniref:DUF6443 domain-containing protein n=1 Tax=Chitinophaga rhizophila TaxID=2866212 RepID=A0ABS7G6M8_9BACT|nr:DUF6443 domain-containing protein [Chitinophaga rhizophila]MBW8683305.1 hypothetical protein [Chitinophaga rhizophila]
MRTHQLAIGLLLLCIKQSAIAQHIPVTVPPYTPVTTPAPLPDQRTKISYVRTWLPRMRTADPAAVMSPAAGRSEVRQSTTYLDGLGRPLQIVEKQGSPSGNDLVMPALHQVEGKAYYQHLPFVPLTGNTNDGTFKADPFQLQEVFYRNTTLNPGINGESYFFHQTEYDTSPLGYTQKTYLPGNAYTKAAGNKPRLLRRITNTTHDSVRIWGFADGDLLPVTNQLYAPGMLYKKVTIDEDGHQMIEYADFEGHIILRKLQAEDSPGTGHAGWACTYYTYDDLGKLRVVIPPKAVQAIQSDWIITPAIADQLCQLYRYDARGRMIISKQPGSDSLEQIFDIRNRLIAARTGVLKSRYTWELYYYDDSNRPRSTGHLISTASRDSLVKRINAAPYDPAKPVPGVNTDSNYTLISQVMYDNYIYGGNLAYSGADALKVEAGSNQYTDPPSPVAVNMPHRLVTGRVTTIPGLTRQFLTRYHYDNKGRLVQSVADNAMAGYDVTSYMYDFEDKLICTYLRQASPKSIVTQQTTLLTIYHYDADGRLDTITKRLNDNPALQLSVAAMDYDALGRLKTKKLSVSADSGPQESQVYEYDLRGRLTGINRPFVNTPNSTANWFGQTLSYESGFTNNQYNGSLSGIKWKSGSDGTARAYGYSYDHMNRLTTADFNQQNSGGSVWSADKTDFSMTGVSYDIGGNIRALRQKGMNGMAIQTIDSLKYGYHENTNRLSYITDDANNPQTILGDFRETVNTTSADYTYDPDGNMSKDRNKDIDSIIYDQNNQPSVIFTKKGMIYLQYNSVGELLNKIIIDTSAQQGSTRVINYVNGFVYERDTLRHIAHADGRIRAIYTPSQPIKYVYDVFVKDHQGSVRVVLGHNRDTADYFASMESARSGVENTLFSNIDNTRAALPSGYPVDNTTDPNSYVSKLNGVDGAKIGPSLVLRVMKGDTVAAVTRAFYKTAAANTSGNTAETMVAALLQAFNTVSVSQGAHFSGGPNSPLATSFSGNAYQQLVNQEPAQNYPLWPKAYLSFVLFDHQFNMVPGNSGVRQVQGPPDVHLNVVLPQMVIEKSGFLYIYLSNESAADMYFDNFTVRHLSGPLLEDTHYYPMGLLMEGISSKALKGTSYLENKHRYKGNQLHNNEMRQGPGLDWYNENNRMYDVQTGRWFSIPSRPNNLLNPYQYNIK